MAKCPHCYAAHRRMATSTWVHTSNLRTTYSVNCAHPVRRRPELAHSRAPAATHPPPSTTTESAAPAAAPARKNRGTAPPVPSHCNTAPRPRSFMLRIRPRAKRATGVWVARFGPGLLVVAAPRGRCGSSSFTLTRAATRRQWDAQVAPRPAPARAAAWARLRSPVKLEYRPPADFEKEVTAEPPRAQRSEGTDAAGDRRGSSRGVVDSSGRRRSTSARGGPRHAICRRDPRSYDRNEEDPGAATGPFTVRARVTPCATSSRTWLQESALRSARSTVPPPSRRPDFSDVRSLRVSSKVYGPIRNLEENTWRAVGRRTARQYENRSNATSYAAGPALENIRP